MSPKVDDQITVNNSKINVISLVLKQLFRMNEIVLIRRPPTHTCTHARASAWTNKLVLVNFYKLMKLFKENCN